MSRRKKEKELPDWDDGRTVANMNVDGMPWYLGEARRKREEEEAASVSAPDTRSPLTRGEQRALLRGVLGATLLVGAVFAVGFLLFILFCVFVWFK